MKKLVFAILSLIILTLGINAQTSSKEKKPKEFDAPEKVVQKQLDAYNRQDIKAFLATYSDDIKIYNFGSDKPSMEGKAQLEKSYSRLFKEVPDNYAALTSRIIQGNFVIDGEKVTGGNRTFEAVAIYEVKDGLITKVWFLR